MSARGAAPAPLADPVALLAGDGAAFFFADRSGRVLCARGRADARRADATRVDAVRDPPPSLFLGAAPFDATPSRDAFVPYAEVVTAEPDSTTDATFDGRLPVLTGELEADADRTAWRGLVRRALDAIGRGDASKIVLARSVRLRAAAPVDAQTLARSMMRAEGTFRYLVRDDGVVFAGATPELLVRKTGDVVHTEAVAGTAPADDDDSPLAGRDKDRREHHAVVLAIEESLSPLTLALDHPSEPTVRRHGRVAHLVTPFEARVDASTHVLDLAAALHPTPAVAGSPRDVALEFIATHEPLRRGLYAGPIGWFDANGDGELAVALRCVRIDGQTVELFAGAGIVSGSDPDAEFDETTLKMRSTLASLGFEGAA